MNDQSLQSWNEHQVECWVERMIDSLDLKYMTSQITTEEYQQAMDAIKAQADRLSSSQFWNKQESFRDFTPTLNLKEPYEL